MAKGSTGGSDAVKWKNKYLDAVESFDKKENILHDKANLLQRMLVRVSLAAEGQSPELDAELGQLRDVLRSSDPTTSALNSRLESLERVVVKMDEQRSDSSGVLLESLEKLTDQLSELEISRNHKKQLKNFSRELKKRINSLQDYPSLLSEYATLQEMALRETFGEASSEPGFFEKLFRSKQEANPSEIPSKSEEVPEQGGPKEPSRAPVDTAPEKLTDSEAMDLSQTTAGAMEGTFLPREEDVPGFSTVASHIGSSLKNLLEQMIIPDNSLDDAQRLKKSIETGLNWYELGPTLDDLASLVISAISKGQRDFEAFLKQMDERLARFKEFLGQSRNQTLKWQSNSSAFDELLRGKVGSIASSIDQATELESLKDEVSSNLDEILSHLSEFMDEENDREKELQVQVDTMQQRFKTMEDETEVMRKRLQEEHKRALTDALTELPNREAYEERSELEFERWRRYGQPLTIVIADIDLFKQVNDTYGHLAGDKVIQIMAKELRRRIRKTDFVARYGGEEFVILMPETEVEMARPVMEKTREMVAKLPFHFRNEKVRITMSFGVSQFQEGLSRQEQLERADKALYQAKQGGRNCVKLAE